MKSLLSSLVGFAAGFVFAAIVIHGPGRVATQRVEVYPDGAVRREYGLDSSGRLHGPMKEYFPSGDLQVESEWEHGIAVGASRHYDENGTPIH